MKKQLNIPFELGKVVITSNAQSKLNQSDILNNLSLHKSCCWGDLCAEDWELNNKAVKSGNDRIFSSYKDRDDNKFWIITEWDRSYTTILLPEDY